MSQRRAVRGSVLALLVGVLLVPPVHSAQPSASPLAPWRALSAPIVFSRFLPGADMGALYRIDPDVDGETQIREVFDAAILSPDGSRFLDFAPTPEEQGSTAVYALDGSGYHVLPADPALNLPGGVWSEGSHRVVTESWGLDWDAQGFGLYSRRSSDGGDLRQLTHPGDGHDFPIRSSPDGSLMVFYRPNPPGETSDSAAQDVFAVSSQGGEEIRLSPPGTTTAFVFSHDSSGFSPDGTRIALVLAQGAFWDTTMRSVHLWSADGSGVEAIGPVGDIWDVAWSPDGEWLAFTMSTPDTDGLHQLYLMRPDGSDVRGPTDGSDGRFSLQPVWSPDGTQILLLRGARRFSAGGPGDPHVVDLWVLDVTDGTLHQVTDVGAEYRGVTWLSSDA